MIATGDETIEPGTRLHAGQIFDSNSPMLRAMLLQMGIVPVRVRRVGDRHASLSSTIRAALAISDVVIVTGGVSVGKRDYLRSVLQRLRVREVFWRVAQKPGKPLYFGSRGRRLVFGLPGNPASVFTCFYVYVYPALREMAGHRDGALSRAVLRVSATIAADPAKWRFLKARRDRDGHVDPSPHQGSHMITSLATADSLMVVPPDDDRNRELVETYRLPYSEDMP